CYDRLKEDLIPACAKACPTESIQFGDLETLQTNAQTRVEKLHTQGLSDAYLYGEDAASQPGTEGLHAFFLLLDKPEVYNLPPDPVVPTKKVKAAWISMAVGAAAIAAAALGSVLFDRGNGT
ncbi:MAG: 4Fe-4S dicluster domain-containing protein, partial [Bryobacteraceae bacterium]